MNPIFQPPKTFLFQNPLSLLFPPFKLHLSSIQNILETSISYLKTILSLIYNGIWNLRRNRSRNNLQLRRSLAERQSRNRHKRPRKPYNSIIRSFHRLRAANRRRREKPSGPKPLKHNLRRQTLNRA